MTSILWVNERLTCSSKLGNLWLHCYSIVCTGYLSKAALLYLWHRRKNCTWWLVLSGCVLWLVSYVQCDSVQFQSWSNWYFRYNMYVYYFYTHNAINFFSINGLEEENEGCRPPGRGGGTSLTERGWWWHGWPAVGTKETTNSEADDVRERQTKEPDIRRDGGSIRWIQRGWARNCERTYNVFFNQNGRLCLSLR